MTGGALHDEALRIAQQELLPVFEELGDVYSRAVVQGKIADILTRRRQFDEALHIHQLEELPVYEQLGDVRSRAVTQGKIADILGVRGQLDEALRILQQEVLPVIERLGDTPGQAIIRAQIAELLWRRHSAGDRPRAAELFTQALQGCHQLHLAETAAIEADMRKRGLPIPPATD